MLNKRVLRLDKKGILVLVSSIFITSIAAQTRIWDVTQLFGVTTGDAAPGTVLAIDSARNHFAIYPHDTIVLHYPAGSYDFHGPDPSVDLGNGFNSGTDGRLVFEGEGKESTRFVTKDRKAHAIEGRNIYRIAFTGIHFARDYCTVTQGTVLSVATGEVILELHEDFPTPDSLWQYGIIGGWGLYLKRYTDDPDDPHIITENNSQVAWDKEGTYQVDGRVWRVALKNAAQYPPYIAGDIIGVKLKHGGQTYWLSGGDNVVFDDCKWTQKTRGVLRGGISNIRFSNCLIDRGPRIGGRVPCLASPGGGPQCGQPNDPRITNVIIENCQIISPGDDNVAFFNVDYGAIRNCHFADGFARGTLLYHVTDICLKDNLYERCSPKWEGGDTESKCPAPEIDPPANLTANEITHESVQLAWDPSPDSNMVDHYEVIIGSQVRDTTSSTSLTVTRLHPNTYYVFSIKAVDADGNSSARSNSVGITTLEKPLDNSEWRDGSSKRVKVYPVPSGDRLFIESKSIAQPAPQLTIYDSKGKLMYRKNVSNALTEVDLVGFTRGLYLLVYRQGNTWFQRKIVRL